MVIGGGDVRIGARACVGGFVKILGQIFKERVKRDERL